MENPQSWSPLQKAIHRFIEENQVPELLSYELVDKLKKCNLLPKSVDEGDLVSTFEEVIFKHEESIQQGICGASLTAKLSRVIK